MVDSDMSTSETSSTASDALLIISSAPKADSSRFERCYSRSALLQLSKSDKVCAPKGLKHLSEWYGEYEPPSAHPGNSNTHGGANGPGGARYYATKERSHRTGGQNERGNERYNDRERDGRDANSANAGSSASAGRSSSASATGAMGDFKLAGSKPFSKDIDSNDALSGGRPRRLNGRDNDFSSKGIEGRELRPWSATGPGASTDADRRRQVGGDFVKKDGRAAEEGGWRTTKELERMSRNRERDGARPSPLDRDRDLRGLGDRRRQPAWMDEDEPSSGGSKASPSASSTFQRRGQNGSDSAPSSGGGMPAWMADGASKVSNTHDNSLEALEAKHGTTLAAPGKAQHVDSIQAWKAEMKALEQKKKRDEQRELRREMGLPDLPDTDEGPSSKDTPAVSASEPQTQAPVPAKSVFSDFLLPSASKDKDAPKAEEKPRSSRFAKMFVAGAAEPANSQQQRSSSSSSTPTSQQPPNQQSSANSGGNSLLAALMPGAGSGTMQRDGSSPKPPPSQADSQSMARLMEMLHMSSTPSQDGHPISSSAGQQHRPPSPSRNDPVHLSQPDRRPRQQQPGGAQALSVLLSQQQQQQHAHHPPSSPYEQQVQSPPRSRLGNRTSSQAGVSRSAADPAQMGQGIQRPDSNAAQNHQIPQYQQQGISPPPPANINLLQLLSGQMHQQPPGPPNDGFLNHPQQQQQNLRQQRPQQPVQSPPPPAPQGRQHPSAASPADQQAHLAAFMQAQVNAGRMPRGASHGPLGSNMPPLQHPGQQQQYGRPPSQGPPLPQQHSHPSHMRSPSGSVNPAFLMQQQQQQHHQSNGAPSPFNGPPGTGPGNHPLPPHANPNFAQQNALAQLLAQGAAGGAGRGLPGPGQGQGQGPAGFGLPPPQQMQHPGMGPDPRFQARGPPDQPPWAYQQQHQHQHQPLPPHHQQSNMHHAPSPQMQMQQNQIDLMALLTGGRK